MAKRPPKYVKKDLVNPYSLWEGYVFSLSASIFTKEGNLDGEFSDVGEPSPRRAVPRTKDKIYNEYGNCTIHLYEYIFSSMGVRLSFIAFEVEVLKFLMVAPSQLHPTS